MTATLPTMARGGSPACRPVKQIIALAEARRWSPETFLVQRKYDGEFAQREIVFGLNGRNRFTFLGEHVRPKSGGFFTSQDRKLLASHGEFFAAFTVAAVDGRNVLGESTRSRWELLNQFPWHSVLTPANFIRADSNIDVEDFNDGEGFCAHAWDAPWGEMLAVKQAQIYVCRVTRTGGTQSVGIEILQEPTEITEKKDFVPFATFCSKPTGSVKLGGGKCDQVRVGSIIRVEGMGLTDAGKIRQPKPCREWLVKW